MVVTRFSVFETRGGAVVDEVEPADYDWQEQSNTAETVNLTFVDRVQDWRNIFTPWKHSIAVEVGNRVLGGPITLPGDLDGDRGDLKVSVRGLRFLFDGMPILPVAALTQDLAPGGEPNTAFDTLIEGVDRGTIGKRLLQQMMTWPGWSDVPIAFHPDRAGTSSQSYTAVDRKSVGSGLSDLSDQENGPDIRLRLTRTSEDSFGWVYESGTDAQPRLQGEVPLDWEPSYTSGFSIRPDASRMGSMAWSEGGRSSDTTLIRGKFDSYLIDRGFPLMHLESGMSSTASDPAAAESWNAETLRTARRPWEFWSFRVPADESPYPHEYGCGDLAQITLSPRMQHRAGLLSGPDVLSSPGLLSGGQGEDVLSDFLEARQYKRRIVGIAGSSTSDEITITCGEAYDG
jgi:hypothetical protein